MSVPLDCKLLEGRDILQGRKTGMGITKYSVRQNKSWVQSTMRKGNPFKLGPGRTSRVFWGSP